VIARLPDWAPAPASDRLPVPEDRTRTHHARSRTGAGDLRPVELAYINGGPQLAVAVALSKLRTLRLLGPDARRSAAGSAETAAGAEHADPIVRAVFAALADGDRATVDGLLAAPDIAGELDALGVRLHRRGLVATAASRRRARRLAWIVEALVAVGLLRLGVDLLVRHRMAFVLLETVVMQAAAVVLWSVDATFAEAAGIPRTAASGSGGCAAAAATLSADQRARPDVPARAI
jgi:uncharacterized protein (TIGR04222 family)